MAPHPKWRPNPEWPEEVGCVLYRHPEQLVLIDPLVREDLDRAAWTGLDEAVTRADTPVAVLLTAPWHERSTSAVVDRYEAGVWAAPSARARVSALPRLESLPDGISAFTPRGVDEGQVAFLIEAEDTLVVAEFFLGTDSGLVVSPSPGTRDLREFAESLHELEHMAIRRVLVAHGRPALKCGSEAISAALEAFGSV